MPSKPIHYFCHRPISIRASYQRSKAQSYNRRQLSLILWLGIARYQGCRSQYLVIITLTLISPCLTKQPTMCRSLGKARIPDNNEARKIIIDYTLAAAKALTPSASTTGKKMRFLYLSGAASERDQVKPLWFMQDYRRIRVRSNHPSLISQNILTSEYRAKWKTNL